MKKKKPQLEKKSSVNEWLKRFEDSDLFSKEQRQKSSQVSAGAAGKLQQFLFSTREQQAFLEDWTSMVEDGVAPVKALETLRLICSKNSVQVVDAIMQSVTSGHTLSNGMKGWFPPTIIELIDAGETGGTLPQTMRSATEAMQKKSSTIGSLFATLSYPMIVLLLGLYVTVYINNSILSQFASILPIERWPAQGRSLVAFANLVQNWWWVLLIVCVGSVIGLYQFLYRYIGDYREYVDKVPLLSLYRRIAAARFMETLGLLTSNGVVFKKALGIMQIGAGPYTGWHLMLMQQRLGRGQSNIADVLDTGMVEMYDVLRLKAVAQGHGFEEALVRQGKLAAERSSNLIRLTTKVVSGALLGLGTVLAAFIITSIYSVGSQLGSSLQSMG